GIRVPIRLLLDLRREMRRVEERAHAGRLTQPRYVLRGDRTRLDVELRRAAARGAAARGAASHGAWVPRLRRAAIAGPELDLRAIGRCAGVHVDALSAGASDDLVEPVRGDELEVLRARIVAGPELDLRAVGRRVARDVD